MVSELHTCTHWLPLAAERVTELMISENEKHNETAYKQNGSLLFLAFVWHRIMITAEHAKMFAPSNTPITISAMDKDSDDDSEGDKGDNVGGEDNSEGVGSDCR